LAQFIGTLVAIIGTLSHDYQYPAATTAGTHTARLPRRTHTRYARDAFTRAHARCGTFWSIGLISQTMSSFRSSSRTSSISCTAQPTGRLPGRRSLRVERSESGRSRHMVGSAQRRNGYDAKQGAWHHCSTRLVQCSGRYSSVPRQRHVVRRASACTNLGVCARWGEGWRAHIRPRTQAHRRTGARAHTHDTLTGARAHGSTAGTKPDPSCPSC
jgi:hypothetical protein